MGSFANAPRPSPDGRGEPRRPARDRRRAGDDRGRETPRSLFGLIWQSSWHDQVGLALLSIAVFAASVAPLELQRRIVNRTLADGNIRAIVLLASLYIGVALLAGLLKLALNVYRGYVTENAVRHLRAALLNDFSHLPISDATVSEGVEVALVLDEADPIGGFAGVSVSEPVLQGGLLFSVFGYLIYLKPLMGLVALLVFTPQILFVPAMQRAINRRVASRISILREVSSDIIARPQAGAGAGSAQDRFINEVFSLNFSIFRLKSSMNFLMNMMHHFGVAGILALGGYYVVTGQTEAGTVVAFISGLHQLNDPWGDLVNWFRDWRVTRTKYAMISAAVDNLAPVGPPFQPDHAASAPS